MNALRMHHGQILSQLHSQSLPPPTIKPSLPRRLPPSNPAKPTAQSNPNPTLSNNKHQCASSQSPTGSPAPTSAARASRPAPASTQCPGRVRSTAARRGTSNCRGRTRAVVRFALRLWRKWLGGRVGGRRLRVWFRGRGGGSGGRTGDWGLGGVWVGMLVGCDVGCVMCLVHCWGLARRCEAWVFWFAEHLRFWKCPSLMFLLLPVSTQHLWKRSLACGDAAMASITWIVSVLLVILEFSKSTLPCT